MQLTNAEEQVMKLLWKLDKAFIRDLLNESPDPKPASTTVLTLLKRMIDKEFVSYKQYGNSREYYPLIKKTEYFSDHLNGLIKDFFNNSTAQFASFFTNETEMSPDELKKLRDIVDEKIDGFGIGGRLDELDLVALRVEHRKPAAAVGALLHLCPSLPCPGRQVLDHPFGVAGVKGRVAQPVDSLTGRQRQHFNKLLIVEGVAHALRILGVGLFRRADDLAVIVIGGRGVGRVDGQVRDARDFWPG